MSQSNESQPKIWISPSTSRKRNIWNRRFILLQGKLNREMICRIGLTDEDEDEDCQEGRIFLNDVARKNLDVGVGDKIFYEYPLTVKRATKIVVSPMDRKITTEDLIDDYIVPFFEQNEFVVIFKNYIFTAPNINSGRSAEFKIIQTLPSPFCKVCPETKFVVEYVIEIDANVKPSNYRVGDISKSLNKQKRNDISRNNQTNLQAECSALAAFVPITTLSTGCSAPKKMRVETEQQDKLFKTDDLKLAESNPLLFPSQTISISNSDSNIADASNHVFEKIPDVKVEFVEEEPVESDPIQVSPGSVPAPGGRKSSAPSFASTKRGPFRTSRVTRGARNKQYRENFVKNANKINCSKEAQENALNSLQPQQSEVPPSAQRASNYSARPRRNVLKVDYTENQSCKMCSKDFYTVEELEIHEKQCVLLRNDGTIAFNSSGVSKNNTGFIGSNNGASETDDIQIIEWKLQKVDPVQDPVSDDDYNGESSYNNNSSDSSDSENADQSDVVIDDTPTSDHNYTQQTNNAAKSLILNKAHVRSPLVRLTEPELNLPLPLVTSVQNKRDICPIQSETDEDEDNGDDDDSEGICMLRCCRP